MAIPTNGPQKVLTERQYRELCQLASDVAAAAKEYGAMIESREASPAEVRAARRADSSAYEALVMYVSALTKWKVDDA